MLDNKVRKVTRSIVAAVTAFVMCLFNCIMAFADVDTDAVVQAVQQGSADGGVFKDWVSKIKVVGSDAYTLVTTLCIIGFVLCVIGLGFSIFWSKEGNKRMENKGHIPYMLGGGVLVFGAGTVVQLISAFAKGI